MIGASDGEVIIKIFYIAADSLSFIYFNRYGIDTICITWIDLTE